MESKARQRQVCLGWVASCKHRSIALESDCPSRESHQDRIVSCHVMLPAFVPFASLVQAVYLARSTHARLPRSPHGSLQLHQEAPEHLTQDGRWLL
jgi:hypothetical protein